MKADPKPFLVLSVFILCFAVFANAAVNNTNLADGGQTLNYSGESPSEIDYDVFGGGSSLSAPEAGMGGGAESGGAANSSCGSTYTVKSGDTLSRIARACGIALKDLLAANAAIRNPNLITAGQKITIFNAAPAAIPAAEKKENPSPTAKPSPTSGPGIFPGETVTIEVQGFPPNAEVQVGIGKVGEKPVVVAKAMTGENGELTARVTVPAQAGLNEKWMVTITTVEQPQMKVTSAPFTIGSN